MKGTVHDTESVLSEKRNAQRLDIVLKKRVHNESINPTPWVVTQFAPESLDLVTASRACG